MVPSVTAASTSTTSVIGLTIAALIGAIGSITVGRINARATVTAARIAAGPRRPGRTGFGWVVALALLGGIVGMVATALWVGPGGSGGGQAVQAGPASSDEAPADPAPQGGGAGKDWPGTTARPPSPDPGASAERAPCPDREQFSRAERLGGGSFTVVEMPADGSDVVLQMGVLGNSGEILITICQDPAGAYWYLSRVGHRPLVGVVAPATPVSEGVYADVTFPDRAVHFVVSETGVTIGPTEELPLTRVVCRAEHLPGDLASLGDPGDCTTETVDPWNV
jgi:hypothetical protein